MGCRRSRAVIRDHGIRQSDFGRRGTRLCRSLSMDAAEGYMPQALSLAHRFPGSSLASRRDGRSLDRNAARYLLLRLLLDANGVAVRGRTDEPRLGCCDRALGAAGEDDSLGGQMRVLTGVMFIEW